jgi:hypothetical protein
VYHCLHSSELRQAHKRGGTTYTGRTFADNELCSLRKDYEFGIMLVGTKGVAKVVDIWKRTLILEPLEPLKAWPIPLKEFWKLSIHITRALANLHDRNIFHNSICPRWEILV